MRFVALATNILFVLPIANHPHESPTRGQDGDDGHIQERDWHIGCTQSDECFYYEDHAADHHVSVPLQHLNGKHEVGIGYSIRKSYDLDHGHDSKDHDGLTSRSSSKPDWNIFRTRCTPGPADKQTVIQWEQGGTWVDYFTCLNPGSCVDLMGHGACRVKKDRWIIPGQLYLTLFKCKKRQNHFKCRFVKEVSIKHTSTALQIDKRESKLEG